MTTIREPILHVDMDAFFVEVERLERPELRGVPVVVGGLGNRGVVSSASYEARRHGVRSAMPTAEARRRCPQARFVPPDHAKYRRASVRVFAVLESFTPHVEAVSVDEAFLDVAGLSLHYDSAGEVGESVRQRLRGELGLPASVGAAASKFIAKLASERAKPDGLVVIPAGQELEFLHPLGVRALWGVGEATYAALEQLGVKTVGDLAALPRVLVVRRLGEAMGAHLYELAWARDERPVVPRAEPKSISVEHTYEDDLRDPATIDHELFRHCHRLARRLRTSGMAGRTVTLKVRFSDFETVTRSHSLDGPVDRAQPLYRAARRLADRVTLSGRAVRLLGVGASSLTPAGAPRQLGLEGDQHERLARATDDVRGRFGDAAVRPARLIGDPSRPPEP